MTITDAELRRLVKLSERARAGEVNPLHADSLVPQLAAELLTLREALRGVQKYAKTMRKAAKQQGPREYQDDRRLMKVWENTCYSEGKVIDQMCRAALAAAPGEP
jgi:hypothetical protein